MKKKRRRYGKKTKTWRTYTAWMSMKQRIKTSRYKRRNITVCPQWSVFANFLADMGECPMGMTLDRIDNDGHYGPENCRWATMHIQNWNKSDTLKIYHAKRYWTVRDIVKLTGFNPHTIRARMQRRPGDWAYATKPLQLRQIP